MFTWRFVRCERCHLVARSEPPLRGPSEQGWGQFSVLVTRLSAEPFRGRKQRGPILARAEAELPASVSRVFVSIASSTRGCAPSSTRSTSPAKLARSQGSSAFHRREYPETPPEHNLACSQHIHLGLGQLKLRLGHADPISSPAPCFVSQDDNSRVERRTKCPRSSTRS